jgi:hypothetical protein
VRRVVDSVPNWRDLVGDLQNIPNLPAVRRQQLLHELGVTLEMQERTVAQLRTLSPAETLADLATATFLPQSLCPELCGPLLPGGVAVIDRINQYSGPGPKVLLNRSDPVLVKGWAVVDGEAVEDPAPVTLVLLREQTRECYFAQVNQRTHRPDIAANCRDAGLTCGERVGFECLGSLDEVPEGVYRIGVIQHDVESGCGFVTFVPTSVVVRAGATSLPPAAATTRRRGGDAARHAAA